MKLLSYGKDGGPESTVEGWWLVELKSLFSIVLLKFSGRSREAYHTHAFDAVSWVLRGALVEHIRTGEGYSRVYRPSWKPIVTRRSTFHKVDSDGVTWALSLRGPWSRYWQEHLPATNEYVVLTHGRKRVV